MGIAKERWMRQEELGYVAREQRYVCPGCVADRHLATVLRANLEDQKCSYCGREPSADWEVLLDEVGEAISEDYTDPVHELPYVGGDGGYQGHLIDGSELVCGLTTWTGRDDLFEDVATAFAGREWCERQYFSLNRFDALHFGWARFSNQVKHRTRFLILGETGEGDAARGDEIPPGHMLDALGELFREFELCVELEVGTALYRVRVVQSGERPSAARDLGTAPFEAAIFPNRMSPAGVPMFYSAVDEETAVVETFDPKRDWQRDLALAEFRNRRRLRLIDLTRIPAVPSDFDSDRRMDRHPLRFLHSLEQDFTKPIARDDRVHINYVPTQIVTEYLRHRFLLEDGDGVDGVAYRSSRQHGETAMVIFADPEDCGPREHRGPLDREPFLELANVRYALPTEFTHLWPAI